MEPDLDDTRLSVPPTRPAVPEADVDDTVVRPAGGVVPAAPTEPPALVEPPAPEVRPLPVGVASPLFVEPVLPPVPAAVGTPKPAAGVVDEAPGAAETFRARLANGTEVPIDVPVYVGRKPSIPRIHVGPAPRLVTMPSPGRELSATHLELRVVGGSLVASDMWSTNGTVVTLPGAPPRTLLRGESAVVVAGTRIDLGEDAVIDVLVDASPEGGS